MDVNSGQFFAHKKRELDRQRRAQHDEYCEHIDIKLETSTNSRYPRF